MIAENRILWLPGEERSWDDDGGRSPAGVRITPENATSVAAVFSCLRILAETVAGLPLHLLERTESGGKRLARELPLYRRLHSQPNNWQTSFEWREQAVMHVALWGDAFSELVPGASGAIDQIVPLHPSRMKVETLENGRLRYSYRESGGRQTVYSDEQILHMRGPSDDGVHGISIVEECREAIALARACEVHGARFFGAGARPGFILSTENQLNADARRELAENWNRKHRGPHNAHETAVLTGGLKPYEVPYASNSDSQYLELRDHQLREIARLFRIPGYLLGLEQGSPQSEIQFVTHTIMPWLRRFESAFLRDLIVDDEKYLAEFDVRGLLRGDAASRSSYYRAMWDIGVVSTNDIRASENLDPVEGGDERYRPLNMGTLGAMPSVDDVLAQQQPGSGIDGQAVEGGVAAAQQGQPADPVAASEASLTTADVSSLLTVVKQITDGLLTVDAARAIISAAFPVLSAARVETILQGVQAPEPEQVAEPPVAARSLSESRAMTISIDFDRTFAADPQLWGEFAAKSVADGNTVVMISRRPDTPEDRQTVTETLGQYAPAFSQVLLVGGETMKADAAQAAGISVDVWVDDSPQFIRSVDRRAEPGSVAEGDFVSWDSSGGRARGRIDHVMDYGTLDIPGTDFKIDATKEDPAALITLYQEVSGGWRATATQVGHKVATLTKIDALPEPPPVEENGYGKPKRKPSKRNCGTGAGGFKPGNNCGEGEGEGGKKSGGGGKKSGVAAHVQGSKAHKEREKHRSERKPSDYPVSNPEGVDTQRQHQLPDGTYTPERRKMHEQIIEDATAGVPPSTKPTLFMMGGGPASGKSSIVRTGLVKHPDDYVLSNPDDIKEDIPEYRDGLAKGDLNAAWFSHEESSDLNKRVMGAARKKSQDVVWDGTGDNSIEKLTAQVQPFRDAGYEVQADYVTCDTDAAVARSQAASRNPNSDRYGREVPEGPIRQTHANVSRIWPEAVARGLFDRSDLYDTNAKGTPVKIASAKGKELTIYDAAAYKRFLAKAKS